MLAVRRPGRARVVGLVCREPARLVAFDRAQPEVVAPLVGFHVGVAHGVGDQVTGGRDGGSADSVDSHEMLDCECIGESYGCGEPCECETNNLACHLYSSYTGEALQSRGGGGLSKPVKTGQPSGSHVHADPGSGERGDSAG
jgi:hypothetical protein